MSPLLNRVVRLRIGIASFVLSIGLLTGSPIGGGLLSPPKDFWWRALVFASVSGFLSAKKLTELISVQQGYTSCWGRARRDKSTLHGTSQGSTIRLIIYQNVLRSQVGGSFYRHIPDHNR